MRLIMTCALALALGCGSEPAAVSEAAAPASDKVDVRKTVRSELGINGAEDATCATGELLTGGGCICGSATDSLVTSAPLTASEGFYCECRDSGVVSAASVQVYAICVKAQ